MSPLGTRLAAAGLRAPRYDGRHLGLVLPAVTDALGAGRGPEDAAARATLGLEPRERAVVVLVDGLGRGNLVELAGHAPFLRSLLAADTAGLVTGFPTTTASALGLLGTGHPGGRTGLVGYAARNPATGGLGNFVRWEGAPAPHEWQREPSLLGGLVDRGVRVTSVGLARFSGSGLTSAVFAGATYVPADRRDDRVDATLAALRTPGLVYLYWGELDKVGHRLGWRSAEWGAALETLDAELSLLARSLPRGTNLVVTADHGMVDVDLDRRVDLADRPSLVADVALLGGEPRAVHVYLRGGVDAARAAVRWSEELAEHAVVATRDEVVDGGWFGDVRPHVLPAVGDLVVVAKDRATVVDSARATSGLLSMVGVHGSLTPLEVEVPFLRVAT